jgi:hypothetical protein
MTPEVKLLDDGKRLQITLDTMNPPVMSKSGKCLLLASAMVKSGIIIDGVELKVGVNAMLKVPK